MEHTPTSNFGQNLLAASSEFWWTYYKSMKAVHSQEGRALSEPIKDRNLGSTDAQHIAVFEQFWRMQLAEALGVDRSDVGPRKIHFRPYRSKNFDVCWPLEGDPKILISVKSMQNAYRNLTNRIEEAIGDSAVLRIYESNAAFGFFFFFLDGSVPRGKSERGIKPKRGVAPHLDRIEVGGDFFSLDNVDAYRRPAKPNMKKKPSNRQDCVVKAEQSLLDLLLPEPQELPEVRYDALGFAPTRVSRLKEEPDSSADWEMSLSEVSPLLRPDTLVTRLVETAKLRGLI